MNQEYFERMSEMVKQFQEPMQEMAELNVRTLQSFSYIKPDELTDVKKPERLWEKQMELAVENGHKALDYMQEAFKIYEKALFSLMGEFKNSDMQEAVKAGMEEFRKAGMQGFRKNEKSTKNEKSDKK